MTEQRSISQLRLSRIIASALPAGVVLFWTVTWFVTGGGQNGLEPELLSPSLALWIWAAVALSGFAAALVLRGRAVGTRTPSRSLGRPDEAVGVVGQVQSYLIIAWALMEGPALLAGVFFMLLASLQILYTAAIVYGIGVVMTFPRAEWFGER